MSSTIGRDPSFVDTNVLVYVYDVDAGEKQTRAQHVIRDLWSSQSGALSTQVLQEFYVKVTRKLRTPFDHERARRLVLDFSSWAVHANTSEDIVAAADIADREQLSFWDGLIVAAAKRLGAHSILSEALQTGRTIEGVLIVNPFV